MVLGENYDPVVDVSGVATGTLPDSINRGYAVKLDDASISSSDLVGKSFALKGLVATAVTEWVLNQIMRVLFYPLVSMMI